ncbi:MAG: hypothetical protein J5998_12690 [Clostridia bacterium]|nr:hypothetical protein [Clostridia bacterium]
MIRKLRTRFVRIALAVLALAMVCLAVIINVANWVDVRAELGETLTYLSENGGASGKGFGGKGDRSRRLQNTLDESRYFSVVMALNGETILNDVSRDTGHTADELADIARRALNSGRTGGFSDDYLYTVSESQSGLKTAVFLNCETKLDALRALAMISAAACAGGILLAWLLLALFSNRAIRPLAENIERQKRFITDAGHELKTPLTVISANMDVQTLEAGETDWIRSTRKQVANMRGLVNELIYLSRMDEEDSRLEMKEFDLGQVVREVAEPYEGMAEYAGKALKLSVQEARVCADEAAIRRLISVLCDNAVKYAPEGDVISVVLTSSGRRVNLTVENGLTAPLDGEALRRLFDRFYRVDSSRSKESGGYGIGLAVARAIAEKHGGSITARQTEDTRLRFVVALPSDKRRKPA